MVDISQDSTRKNSLANNFYTQFLLGKNKIIIRDHIFILYLKIITYIYIKKYVIMRNINQNTLKYSQ